MRMFAVVALLIAVAVACAPKAGSDVTTDSEVTLCPAGVPGVALECADASHDMLGHDTDVEHVESHEFTMIDTYPMTTRETRAIHGPYVATDERDDLSGHETMKGVISAGVRAGRPRAA